jgi:hypothetical protein
LWLGDRNSTARVTAVALPHGPGVVEKPGFWQMSTEVYGQVGEWASRRSVVLLALVHSHRVKGGNYLSELDQFASVHVPDFLSIVVGGFGSDSSPSLWGYHVFEGTSFKRLTTTEVAQRLVFQRGSVLSFECDAEGVKGPGA